MFSFPKTLFNVRTLSFAGLLVCLCFLSSGCIRLTDVLIINYLDRKVDISVNGNVIVQNLPPHSQVVDHVALHGFTSLKVAVTSNGKEVLPEAIHDKSNIQLPHVRNEILLIEIKPKAHK